MNLKYRILEAYPDTHTIIVRYYTDIATEEVLASIPEKRADGSPIRCRSDVSISVPIPEPSTEELERLILNNAPTKGLRDVELILDKNVDTSMSNTISLIGITKEHSVFVNRIPTDDEIDNAILALSANT